MHGSTVPTAVRNLAWIGYRWLRWPPEEKKRGKSVTISGTDRGTNWEQNTLEQGATVVALWIEPPI